MWVPLVLPSSQSAACCDTGVRNPVRGPEHPPFIVTPGTDIPGFDEESFFGRDVPPDLSEALAEAEASGTPLDSTLDVCEWACGRRDNCGAFTHVREGVAGPEAKCFLKSDGMAVSFGLDRATMHYRELAVDYSMPGFDDIAALRLTAPIPPGVALPSHVFIRHPDRDTDSPDFAGFLDSQRYVLSGWGGGRPVRQSARAELEAFPFTGPNVMR